MSKPNEKHVMQILDLKGHNLFPLQVKCSCGTTLYAVDIQQAEEHKQWHLVQVKRQQAQEVSDVK